jgi:hypothetical protein
MQEEDDTEGEDNVEREEEDAQDVPFDNIDDGIDELDDLDTDSHEGLLEDTAIVRALVSKLQQLSFSTIQSTTIALPAWRCYCKESNLKSTYLSSRCCHSLEFYLQHAQIRT